jgi:hypothetical protein
MIQLALSGFQPFQPQQTDPLDPANPTFQQGTTWNQHQNGSSYVIFTIQPSALLIFLV